MSRFFHQGFRNGHLGNVRTLAQDGLPFELWDGVTFFESLDLALGRRRTPSKSSTEQIDVYGNSSFYAVKMTIEEYHFYLHRIKRLRLSVDGQSEFADIYRDIAFSDFIDNFSQASINLDEADTLRLPSNIDSILSAVFDQDGDVSFGVSSDNPEPDELRYSVSLNNPQLTRDFTDLLIDESADSNLRVIQVGDFLYVGFSFGGEFEIDGTVRVMSEFTPDFAQNTPEYFGTINFVLDLGETTINTTLTTFGSEDLNGGQLDSSQFTIRLEATSFWEYRDANGVPIYDGNTGDLL